MAQSLVIFKLSFFLERGSEAVVDPALINTVSAATKCLYMRSAADCLCLFHSFIEWIFRRRQVYHPFGARMIFVDCMVCFLCPIEGAMRSCS